MSVYEKRYGVHLDRVSSYVDTPEEVLDLVQRFQGDMGKVWIDEGGGDYADGPNDTLMVTRFTTGRVLISTIEYLVARQEALNLITEIDT